MKNASKNTEYPEMRHQGSKIMFGPTRPVGQVV